MDLRTFLTTFGLIFLAEMGDKTKLAAITMAAQTRQPWSVFIGASLALATVSLIGVLVGSVLANYITPNICERLRRSPSSPSAY